MSDSFSKSAILLIALFSIHSSRAAESYNYSGEVSRSGGSSEDSFQAELKFSDTAVSGFYMIDGTTRRVKIEGQNQPKNRLFLKAFSNGDYWADIKLVKYVSGAKDYAYDAGTIHWVGYLFEKNGQRGSFHLVETDTKEKHPAFVSSGYLPSVGYFLNIAYDPETGKKIYNLGNNKSIGTGRNGTRCIADGIPWLDCTLNYHPVDGCYLTEPQRNICRQGPFDQLVAGITGNCWSFEKGPGIQLPFQRAPTSAFDLTKVEVVKARSDTTIAQRVTASATQIRSGDNFLKRPVCESAFAWGPTCYDTEDGAYECL